MCDVNGPVLGILIVEDECLVREVLVMYLREVGRCEVLEADSGEMALEVLGAADGIDVVITDIRLGGPINGWDVGEAARARGGISVVYTSGYSITPSRQVEGSLFFDKPYDPEAVLQACHRLHAERLDLKREVWPLS